MTKATAEMAQAARRKCPRQAVFVCALRGGRCPLPRENPSGTLPLPPAFSTGVGRESYNEGIGSFAMGDSVELEKIAAALEREQGGG